jgi:hypothetical protein
VRFSLDPMKESNLMCGALWGSDSPCSCNPFSQHQSRADPVTLVGFTAGLRTGTMRARTSWNIL